jgi:hypothetical protein
VQLFADVMREWADAQDNAVESATRNDHYRTDPKAWVHDRLNGFLWSRQADIAQSVVTNRRTAVQACHGVGKTQLAAFLATWWLDVHPPGEAFVVTTAPTGAQVRAILWRYIGRAVATLGRPDLRTNQTEAHLGVAGREELVGFGRKPSDYDPAAFQGIHARYVLVILDEACGIPEQLWIAADALTTNADCRILAIGNPDDATSHFRQVCKPGSGWARMTLSALDSPLFTDEHKTQGFPDVLLHALVSPSWVDEKRREWGEESALFRAKVLGEFTDDATDTVVSPSAISRSKHLDLDAENESVLGVDVGGGQDQSVVRELRIAGPYRKLGSVWRKSTTDSRDLMELIERAIVDTNAKGRRVSRIVVDEVGIGWAVIGWLRERGHDAHGFGAGKQAEQSDRFLNMRAEIWWTAREWIENGWLDLDGIDETTEADLCAPKWSPAGNGRIKVESKDDIRKRLGRSTDDADAVLHALWSPKVHVSGAMGAGAQVAPMALSELLGVKAQARW